MEKKKMKEIPAGDRPYEKCVKQGPSALSDEELLAIIIRTGRRGQNCLETARQVLALSYPRDGVLGLYHLSPADLKKVPGIGTVKAVQLLCVGELSRRISRRSAVSQIAGYTSPDAVVNYYMEDLRHLEQEQFSAMFLDTKNRLIREMALSKGTVSASLVSPRSIFIEALRCRAVKLILVHNHPSGDPTPSEEDRLLTARVRECAELLGIPLLDHIIIGDRSYCSFNREGLI